MPKGGNKIFEKSEGEWKRGGNADFLYHKEGGTHHPISDYLSGHDIANLHGIFYQISAI